MRVAGKYVVAVAVIALFIAPLEAGKKKKDSNSGDVGTTVALKASKTEKKAKKDSTSSTTPSNDVGTKVDPKKKKN
jgi:hypothetical protein